MLHVPPLLLLLSPLPLAAPVLLPPPVLRLRIAGFSLMKRRVLVLSAPLLSPVTSTVPTLLLHRVHAPGPASKPWHVLQAPPLLLLLLALPPASASILPPSVMLPLLSPLSPLPPPPGPLRLPLPRIPPPPSGGPRWSLVSSSRSPSDSTPELPPLLPLSLLLPPAPLRPPPPPTLLRALLGAGGAAIDSVTVALLPPLPPLPPLKPPSPLPFTSSSPLAASWLVLPPVSLVVPLPPLTVLPLLLFAFRLATSAISSYCLALDRPAPS